MEEKNLEKTLENQEVETENGAAEKPVEEIKKHPVKQFFKEKVKPAAKTVAKKAGQVATIAGGVVTGLLVLGFAAGLTASGKNVDPDNDDSETADESETAEEETTEDQEIKALAEAEAEE